MSDASQLLKLKQVRFLAALLLAAGMAALMLGSQTTVAHAENKCTSGELCAWTGTFYSGTEWFLGCASGGFNISIPESRSAKNRCSVSQEIGWSEGGTINWKACMSPGGERPDPGRFNVYRYRASC
jgi:hypothetical protein